MASPWFESEAAMSVARTLITLSGFLLVVAGCGESGTPRLEVQSEGLNFGYVPPEGRDFEIPLTNEGDTTLRIYEIRTSCRCVVAKCPDAISPGETKPLVIKPPGHLPGANAARMYIKSNDPLSPHEVYFSWFGESIPTLDPPRIFAMNLSVGAVLERKVKISWDGGERRAPLEVSSVRCSRDDFSVTVVKSDLIAKLSKNADQEFRGITGETELLFRFTVPQTTGKITGECTISTQQAGKEHVLPLPVEIEVLGKISAAPSSVLFSASNLRSLKGLVRRVAIRVQGSSEAPSVDAPAMLAARLSRSNQTEQEGYYLLELQVKGLPGSPNDHLQVVLRLNDDPRDRLVIPVEVLVVD
jgi:hypothetical protein